MRADARFCWWCGRDLRTREMRYADALTALKDRFANRLTNEEKEALEWAADQIGKRS